MIEAYDNLSKLKKNFCDPHAISLRKKFKLVLPFFIYPNNDKTLTSFYSQKLFPISKIQPIYLSISMFT